MAYTTTKVLPYDRGIVGQERYFDCGPASAQNVLSSRFYVSEADLIRSIGTTENGTDYVGLIERDLDRRVPDARYTSVYLPNDPPTPVQRGDLNRNIKSSIDAGWGVVANIVAPPSNYPKGVNGSASPSYSGGTVYHYVAVMGYIADRDGWITTVWIADSGFSPFGYWITFDQLATLIPPKGYAYASIPPIIAPPPVAPSQPPPVVPPTTYHKLSDPTTKTLLTQRPNAYVPRGSDYPLWIAVHTSESRSSAVNLRNYCENNEVSYHKIVDDTDIVTMVRDDDAPWSATNANKYALHVCASSSFASWSREQWLDPNPSDGFNEDAQLTNLAEVAAYWCTAHTTREIPPVWIGGGAKPPWGLNGILGHVDFGAWGGGHSDPGANFPVNTFIARVVSILTNEPPVVIAPPPPVSVPGTTPSKYVDWMIYRGSPSNDIERVRKVQTRLKRAYAAYAGHLAVDGDYSWSDEMAVREFQRRSGLVVDGIVGPMTAAALKP